MDIILTWPLGLQNETKEKAYMLKSNKNSETLRFPSDYAESVQYSYTQVNMEHINKLHYAHIKYKYAVKH